MKEDFLHKKLQEREKLQAFRKLKITDGMVDLCSNDYLGIVKNGLLKPAPHYRHGSTGSRLLSGNYPLAEEAENLIAEFHESQSALLFNSGYDANVGLLSCVPQKSDTILYDQLCHASIRDGIRLSFAQAFSFRHNDVEDLQKKLQSTTGEVFIVTESVFSMDGDLAPLQELIRLCEQYGCHLILDEAHATGVIGERGEGLAQQLKLHDKCFARVHTFGKAVGCHGAVVLGSAALRDYLINFSRPFIYTTALPEVSVGAICESYKIFPKLVAERKHLQELINAFEPGKFQKLKSSTPIQGIVIPGNEAVKEVARSLQKNGFDVRPILYPTVPKGSERLRIVLHSFNTNDEIAQMLRVL
ncbi:MAG TPA: 8-amino-7-oxononanoate synthase [Chitinophagaceae bacterium]|nr:8-amino-7-oxononanoate synthase [Chitinophagaceae bacterium]